MHRSLRTAALGLVVAAAALAAPTVAFAAPAPGSPAPSGSATALAGGAAISARLEKVSLTGNPWNPGATTHVTVHNGGDVAGKAYFLLTLPKGTELGATDMCDQVTARDPLNWLCAGDELAAGASRDYLIRINTAPGEPRFGVSGLGYVTGRTADGQLGRRNDFLVSWPDQLPLRLAVQEGKWAAGTTKVRVKVTNAGSFAISGYSLEIDAPANVRVDPCNFDSGHSDTGCEIYRSKTLKAGATDTFTVTFTVTGGQTSVGFALTPAQRYTNKDTTATLDLTGDEVSEGEPGGAGAGEETGGSLAVTGIDGGTLAIGGTGLIGVGALLLGMTRRRRLTV